LDRSPGLVDDMLIAIFGPPPPAPGLPAKPCFFFLSSACGDAPGDAVTDAFAAIDLLFRRLCCIILPSSSSSSSSSRRLFSERRGGADTDESGDETGDGEGEGEGAASLALGSGAPSVCRAPGVSPASVL